MKFSNHVSALWARQTISQPRTLKALTGKGWRLGLVVLSSLGVGLAVIISSYYVNNVKLLIGLVGGLAFVLLTMRWPEFGILCYVALLSGLINLGVFPALHFGPISLQISDAMLLFLLGLVFLRTTAKPGFTLFGSPLMLPLLLFIGAFLLSALNAVLISGVGPNIVLRILRVLVSWIMFIPVLQLVRDEQTLRRILIGFLILTGILLLGVLLQNSLSPLLHIEMVPTGTGAQASSDFSRFYYDGDMVLLCDDPGHGGFSGDNQERKPTLAYWSAGLLILLGFQDLFPRILVDTFYCLCSPFSVSIHSGAPAFTQTHDSDCYRCCAHCRHTDGCTACSGRA